MGKLKQFIKNFMPDGVQQTLRRQLHVSSFMKLPEIGCETENLRVLTAGELRRALSAEAYYAEWNALTEQIDKFKLSDAAGGVNKGDRRAIYQLIRELGVTSVLEVGTHIGASTIHIAAALSKNKQALVTADIRFDTVDIIDVNGPSGAFNEFGLPLSPRGMVEEMGFADFVKFHVAQAQEFLAGSGQTHDLIFLDGDHSPAAVYNEVPRALKRLAKNGIILLHDYFPDEEPIWENEPAKHGPYLAIDRHLKSGAALSVLPLGKLEWPTKLGSSWTSLAILAAR